MKVLVPGQQMSSPVRTVLGCQVQMVSLGEGSPFGASSVSREGVTFGVQVLCSLTDFKANPFDNFQVSEYITLKSCLVLRFLSHKAYFRVIKEVNPQKPYKTLGVFTVALEAIT